MTREPITVQIRPDRDRRLRRQLDEARGVIRELLDAAEDDRMDYEESCQAVITRAREYLKGTA